MYISPNLLVLLLGAIILVVGKQLASRCFYGDVQIRRVNQTWHSDARLEYPQCGSTGEDSS